MHTQWIEQRTVQRVSLREGLVLSLDDYNELVIARPMRLTLPAIGSHPSEEVLIDPARVSAQERPLLDLAGAVCTRAWCDDEGALHMGFSRGHCIDVDPDSHETAWELYGKRHGYMACLPHGRVRVVRHDLVDDETNGAAN
ncbi:hypothetical protein FHT40_005752 [Mycolicibacterium sp. BK556]|jgi:uncharacterized protein DUF6188|uniref:Uncharacterized protein n=1 Tax=Mycolicibacterium moriokaense TaxID=39691 RepID=A0AAD1HF76_9MYCO|nr:MULTISPECIES: DUF6188 family protein [Mycolicibacterium]MBB3606063.1 hypothetical protein [Mycolicibacterium sp. BK556]MBB3632640.1 hypothetical protein [Mycolicibacterium sp. BK607]MCV7038725.1 hypothetical protein [Mycolicibacterium moriokaense]ORB25335.1 hypothetical protein BST36_07155 [Mycolicibacterium moriokaense]BBX03665.1 hypothetical protein MMOR_46010 [Mycolicibacterium moriokaense]